MAVWSRDDDFVCGYQCFLSISSVSEYGNLIKQLKVKEKKLAQQYAGLEQADQVDLYNGLESYYSVLGRNKKQEALAVLIGKDDHKIYVYQLNQGVSQEKSGSCFEGKRSWRD